MDTDRHDVMEYDAATGEVTYRAFTEEEAADDAARAQAQEQTQIEVAPASDDAGAPSTDAG